MKYLTVQLDPEADVEKIQAEIAASQAAAEPETPAAPEAPATPEAPAVEEAAESVPPQAAAEETADKDQATEPVEVTKTTTKTEEE